MDNILIIAVTSVSSRRRGFEDKFIEELSALKVNAVPSYQLIDSSQYLSRKVVEKAIEGRNISAVLVTRLAGINEKEVYRQPDHQLENMTYFTYYEKAFKQSNDGYYDKYWIVTLETNLYDTQSGERVWSMQSETFDPSHSSQIVQDQIELTISTLNKRGLIGATP